MAEDNKPDDFIASIPATKKPSRWMLLAGKLKLASPFVKEDALTKVSFFSILLEKAANAANRILKFLDVMALDFSEHLKRLTLGTVVLDFVFGFYEFIRIPLVYLADWFLKGKIKASASKNAQWVYRAMLLGLALATYVFPPAALIAALVSALIILGKNIFSTANMFADRSAKQAQLQEVTQSIHERTAILLELAKQLGLSANTRTFSAFKTALEEGSGVTQDNESHYAYAMFIVKRLEKLQSQKVHLQGKIAGMGTAQIVDRSVGVTLSTLVFMGILVGFATPLIGIGMLAGAGIVGVIYTATVIVMTLTGSRDTPVKASLSTKKSMHNASLDCLYIESPNHRNIEQVTVEQGKDPSLYSAPVNKPPIVEQEIFPHSPNLHN